MTNITSDILKILSGGDAQKANQKKAKATAEDFESVFITDMLNSMQPSAETSDEQGLGSGSAGEQWRSILNEHTARAISKSGGIGLSSSIMDAIIKTQAGA